MEDGFSGKRQSGTTQKTRRAKKPRFGGRGQLERSPGKGGTSPLPAKGLPGGSGIRGGTQVRRGLAPHHRPLLPRGGTAWPRQIAARPTGPGAALPRRAGSSGLAAGGVWCH